MLNLRRFYGLAVVGAGTILSLAPNLTSPMPNRDSGVFLYVGSRMLKGEVPYRDVWDHKGPLIYFLNAVGVAIDPRGEIGIWILEGLTLFLAGWFLYGILARSMDPSSALAGTAIFYGGLVLVLRPGNFTEEYALPLALAALWAFPAEAETQGWRRRFGLVGATLAGVALLRPNLVGMHAAILSWLVYRWASGRRWRRLAGALGWTALGASAVVAPALVYFAGHGALGAAWDSYIRFNLTYQGTAPGSPAGAVREGLLTLAPSGLSPLSIGMWLLVAVTLARRGQRREHPAPLIVAWIALAMEFGVVALARRGLTHYYIAWLPAMSILSAGLLARILAGAGSAGDRRMRFVATSVLTAVCLIWPARRALPNLAHLLLQGPRDGTLAVRELASYPERTLLMWGAEAAYNYFDGRASPSKYVYQYPLYTCGYATDARIDEFGGAIERDRPLIVDTSPTNRSVPPIEPAARAAVPELNEACALSDGMVGLADWIADHYRETGRLSDNGWIVYEWRVDENPE